MKNGIPSLTDLRNYIKREGWNGYSFAGDRNISNAEMFAGECHNASCALSTMLQGFEDGFTHSELVVRGWYRGEITTYPVDQHCHSWVVYNGKILDPTWHQFTDAPAKMYVFDLNDSRFVVDPEA